MKFIHCADLHLNSYMESLPLEVSYKRREEVLRTFEKMCEYAVINNVTAVIIAGDFFDKNTVSKQLLQRVKNAITKASYVDFLYLLGNHDSEVFNRLEDFPKNLKFFTKDWTYFKYSNVVICGIDGSQSKEDLYVDSLNLNKENFNVVVLHGRVAGYNSKDDAEVISIPKYKNKNINYIALGHYHTYSNEKLDDRGFFGYSGCLDGRGFDELGEKGFVLIDYEDTANFTFVPFSSRVFVEHKFDLSKFNNFIDAKEEIYNQLITKYNKTSLIKLVLVGEVANDFNMDIKSLTHLLNEYFFYAKVLDKTILKISALDFQYDKSVVGEFVRAVLGAELNEEDKSKIIATGLNFLRGEK
ncbi:MAG: metallophosphoesterase [Clostridia bacterium]|nr:metallophosphoesterase [Clostridia bacterium]